MRAIAYNVRTKSELECGKISFKDQIDNAKGQLISKKNLMPSNWKSGSDKNG